VRTTADGAGALSGGK